MACIDLSFSFPCWQIKTWRRTDSPKKLVVVWSTSWTYPQSWSSASQSDSTLAELCLKAQCVICGVFFTGSSPILPVNYSCLDIQTWIPPSNFFFIGVFEGGSVNTEFRTDCQAARLSTSGFCRNKIKQLIYNDSYWSIRTILWVSKPSNQLSLFCLLWS